MLFGQVSNHIRCESTPGSGEVVDDIFLAKKCANFVTYLVSWHRHCHPHHLTLCAYHYDLAWLQSPVELEVIQPHEGG